MKIVTLVENSSCREDLECEHGLSLYIETGAYRILFDMGQSSLFAENAEKLGIDLHLVDFAVLSHGHYDHGGGLVKFLEINQTAPVYVSRWAFEPHFNARDAYNGLDLHRMEPDRLVFVDDFREIAPGLRLYSCNDRDQAWPADPFGLSVELAGLRQPDDFRHEQYLLIGEAGRTICISGCSHKGIQNIVHWLRPDVLVGGFHFMKLTDRAELTRAAKALLEYPAVYYTGHCTGEAQFEILKAAMGERLHRIATGTILEP